jgi:hypothetical protein
MSTYIDADAFVQWEKGEFDLLRTGSSRLTQAGKYRVLQAYGLGGISTGMSRRSNRR